MTIFITFSIITFYEDFLICEHEDTIKFWNVSLIPYNIKGNFPFTQFVSKF